MTSAKIPFFYRLFFLYIDPLIGLSGLSIFFLNHPLFLSSGVPSLITSHENTITPLTRYLLFSLGSYSLAISAMQIYLLQTFKDAPDGLNLKIWRFVETAILLIDLGLLGAIWDADPHGMWRPSGWGRSEWSNFGVLGMVVGVRSAFLMNVGF